MLQKVFLVLFSIFLVSSTYALPCEGVDEGIKRWTPLNLDLRDPALEKSAARLTLSQKALDAVIVGDPKKNHLVSAASISTALLMLDQGAPRDLRKKMAEFLLDGVETRYNLVTLQAILRGSLHTPNAEGQKREEGRFAMMNSAWTASNTGYTFAYEFSRGLELAFDANLRSIDFTTQAGVDELNAFVDRGTEHMIDKIMDLQALAPLEWLLMNTAYFQGGWEFAGKLSELNFRVLNAKDAKVPGFAGRTRTTFFSAEDGSAGVRLPTKGGRYALYAVLPREGEHPSGQVLQDGIRTLLHGGEIADVGFHLPKFAFRNTYDLTQGSSLVKQLALDWLFDSKSNFSEMSPLGGMVKLIRHGTAIEVDEKGLKAAAVTVVGGIRSTSVPRPPITTIIFDRPFSFAIVDEVTGLPLFVGSLVDPTHK